MRENPIVIADAQGVIGFWNPAATTAFGHPRDAALGQTLDLVVPPEYRDAHWAGFRRAIAAGRAEAEGHPSPFPVRLASGEVETWPARLALVRAPDGAAVGAMVVFALSPADGAPADQALS